MNRILYLLVGIGVALAMLSAFVERQTTARFKISEMDLAAAAVFVFALAFATFVMQHTRWGRRMRWRFKRNTNDSDTEVRANARNKGEVRPPLGTLL